MEIGDKIKFKNWYSNRWKKAVVIEVNDGYIKLVDEQMKIRSLPFERIAWKKPLEKSIK